MDFFKPGDPVHWTDEFGTYRMGKVAAVLDPRWANAGQQYLTVSFAAQGYYLLIDQSYNQGLILAPTHSLKHLLIRND